MKTPTSFIEENMKKARSIVKLSYFLKIANQNAGNSNQ